MFAVPKKWLPQILFVASGTTACTTAPAVYLGSISTYETSTMATPASSIPSLSATAADLYNAILDHLRDLEDDLVVSLADYQLIMADLQQRCAEQARIARERAAL